MTEAYLLGNEAKQVDTQQHAKLASAAIQNLRSIGATVYPASGHEKMEWNALAGTDHP